MENIKNKKSLPKMPEPPSFLLQELSSPPPPAPPLEKNANMPKSVDYTLYHSVLEDRKSAEIRAAEIYSKYLEIVHFSETLLKKLGRMETYKARVRLAYDRALMADQITLDNLKLARRDMENSQLIINDLNLEIQTLKASLSAHQEAFQQITKQLGQADAAMHHAHKQFQMLSDDYVLRGEKIQELEKKNNGMTSQIAELGERIKTLQKKSDYLNDENLLLQNQVREIQIQESGLATLNEELTNSIPKLQKQIHLLEEKLRCEREDFEKKLKSQEEELSRLKENKIIDALVEKSKSAKNPSPSPSLTDKIEITNKEQWNEFYTRWSLIIDELSSHSAPIKKQEDELPPLPHLVSENGDYEWT